MEAHWCIKVMVLQALKRAAKADEEVVSLKTLNSHKDKSSSLRQGFPGHLTIADGFAVMTAAAMACHEVRNA